MHIFNRSIECLLEGLVMVMRFFLNLTTPYFQKYNYDLKSVNSAPVYAMRARNRGCRYIRLPRYFLHFLYISIKKYLFNEVI